MNVVKYSEYTTVNLHQVLSNIQYSTLEVILTFIETVLRTFNYESEVLNSALVLLNLFENFLESTLL